MSKNYFKRQIKQWRKVGRCAVQSAFQAWRWISKCVFVLTLEHNKILTQDAQTKSPIVLVVHKELPLPA
jgi:hypothetical protein